MLLMLKLLRVYGISCFAFTNSQSRILRTCMPLRRTLSSSIWQGTCQQAERGSLDHCAKLTKRQLKHNSEREQVERSAYTD